MNYHINYVLLLISLSGVLHTETIETLDASTEEDFPEVQNSSVSSQQEEGIVAKEEDLPEILNSSVPLEQEEESIAKNVMLNSKELFKTEFLTFTAPEEGDDVDMEKIEDLLKFISTPRRIFLIEAPENMTILELNGDIDNDNLEKGKHIEMTDDTTLEKIVPNDNANEII